MYHDPCHTPMKTHNPIKVTNALMGQDVKLSDRCCGESGTLAVARPDISTQIRFRKQEELLRGKAELIENSTGKLALGEGKTKILTSCPSCLQGLARYQDDTSIEPDYIVVELAKSILGENWMSDYINQASNGGIERVLL